MNESSTSAQQPPVREFPQALLPLAPMARWVVWRYVQKIDRNGNLRDPNKNSSWDKPPVTADGRMAHTDDDGDLCDYTTAAKALLASVQTPNPLKGAGFAPRSGDGLLFLDLDDCRDRDTGTIALWACDVIADCNSYAEISPSETGIRIIGLAEGWTGKQTKTPYSFISGGAPAKGEIYLGSNYVTITFNRLTNTPDQLSPIGEAANRLAAKSTTGSAATARKPNLNPDAPSVQAPVDVIREALALIPNDEDNWTFWKEKVGLAVYAATDGSDEGFELWDEWSRKGPVYNAVHSCEEEWERMRISPPTRNSGYASLHSMARDFESKAGRFWNGGQLWRAWKVREAGLGVMPASNGCDPSVSGSEPYVSPAGNPELAQDVDAVAVAQLAALPPMEYDRIRKQEAKRMGVRVGVLDEIVQKTRIPISPAASHGIGLSDPEPWPEPVVLADLLQDISAAISRHVTLPSKTADVVALWIAHTWVYEKFEHSPRLGITSPVPRCGKSTLLDVLRALCRRTLKADSLSASSVFRTVQALSPLTLLIDEADSFLPDNEELRGVLNSGYEMSGMVIRVAEVQGQLVPMPFPTFAPVALAAIGRLPATLADRSVPVPLKRKTAMEKVVKLRAKSARVILADLARKLRRWAEDDASRLLLDPVVPNELNDRACDISVPLLAIAAAAGETWWSRGWWAIVDVFGQGAAADDDAERGSTLLADIRAIFDDLAADRVPSAVLSGRLALLHDRPWPECNRGRPITPAHLAGLLKPFGVRSGTIRLQSGETPKGYHRTAFVDAWERYLPPDKQGAP